MTGFVLAAALLTAAGLVFVLWPLLRLRGDARASARSTNLAIYRDQFAELQRDLELGTLDAAQYDNARAELERRMLEEVATEPAGGGGSPRSWRVLALLIAVLMPVAAGLLYWYLGEPEGIVGPNRAAPGASQITQQDFEAMTRQLAERMAANPDDPVGWLMLGRAYKALAQYPEALKALQEADRRRPNEPEILAELAEALGMQGGRKLEGEPLRLLERALKIDPNHPKSLTLAGAAAFEAKDYKRAIGYWERLQRQLPPDSEMAQALQAGLARARQLAGGTSAPGGAEAIRGEVRLAQALQDRVRPEDTVFVVARAVDGPRMPLAVLRREAAELPLSFALDDTLAMAPDVKLSDFSKVIVTARISRNGTAQRRTGDLEGASAPVRPGQRGVEVTIDSVVQ
jgi:cytochrome c-type biogenesis protein CcmH